MRLFAKYLLLILIFYLGLSISAPLSNAKIAPSPNKDISHKIDDEYRASKKIGTVLLNHGWSACKFSISWIFNTNFEWTRGTFQAVKKRSNEAIGFIISALVWLVEFLVNVIYRFFVAIIIFIYSAVVLLIGIVFIPLAWIWNNVFG